MTTPPGKHAPASPASFYASLGRHIFGAVAVLAVVALVIVLATTDDDGAGLAGSTPTAQLSASPSVTPSGEPSESVSPAPARTARPRAEITVVVLNGTRRAGLASQAKERLVAAGYTVIRVGNTSAPVAKTVIFHRPGTIPEATVLLDDFPDLIKFEKAAGPDAGSDGLLTVILGDDYRV